jgi:hypothetical protein
MKIFTPSSVDDEYTLMDYPPDRLRLDPWVVSLNQSGVFTTPLDGVSVLLIQYAIL